MADAEAELMRMAARRPALQQLFSPSLEADVVTAYMLHRRRHYSDTAWVQLVWGMQTSRTVYVGNLSFATREEQIHELFSRAGSVTRVIMGLNAQTRTPCGFAFVEFATSAEAKTAQRCLSGAQLEGRVLRADLDQEFEAGRQYGRSKTGGQLQDDARRDFDEGRGGWGAFKQQQDERFEAAARHRRDQRDTFRGAAGGGAEGDEGAFFDPTETVERVRTDNRTHKMSAATISALTEGVFPHYALPMDDRVRHALKLALEAQNPPPAAAAAAAQNGAAAASVAQPAQAVDTDIAAAVAKRPLSPSLQQASSSERSPVAKRARQQSPAAVSPRSVPQSPVPFASGSPAHGAAAAAASTSPQPMYAGSPRAGSPTAAWGDDDGGGEHARGYTPDHLSDGDRTPPPPREPQQPPLQPHQQLLPDDDVTPPASPDRHHREEELDDDARTPQHVDENAPLHAEVDDDEATPPPPQQADGQEDARRTHSHSNEPSFDEFER